MIFLQGFIKFDIGISEKCVGQTFGGRKKERRIIIIIIIIRTRYDMIWRIINGSQFQKRWRISICKNKIYLEIKFYPNRRIFVFWWPFWIQNGHNSKPKWSPYGAACFTPCKYPFPLKSFHLWIFKNLFWFFNFSIGSHFALLIPIFWAYLVPLDVDVTGNITANICEVWS